MTEAHAAAAKAFAAYLAKAAIEIKTDRKGREFAQYYCRRGMRWIRISLIEAKAAIAAQAEAA